VTARARALALGLLLATGLPGCGQQGPLVLPGDARPVERIDPTPDDPEQNDGERRDER
jgi:predicted small lipoprotein YifL